MIVRHYINEILNYMIFILNEISIFESVIYIIKKGYFKSNYEYFDITNKLEYILNFKINKKSRKK